MKRFHANRDYLLWSLQRALPAVVPPQLRQASIEADLFLKIVRVRFEYDGEPSEEVQESCSVAGTEVIANFPAPWDIDEQHCPVPAPNQLHPLQHVVYSRAEPEVAA
jgi:hypothetical protein